MKLIRTYPGCYRDESGRVRVRESWEPLRHGWTVRVGDVKKWFRTLADARRWIDANTPDDVHSID